MLFNLFAIFLEEFTISNGAKPLCAKFGGTSCTLMVSGDDKNCVSLWRINKTHPLAVSPHYLDVHF